MYTPSRKRVTNGAGTKRAKGTRPTRRVRSTGARVPRSISFGKQVLPRTLNNTLSYVTSYATVANASGFIFFSFRANGMYDPEVAIGGHQPLGYDQLTALYDHWYVKSSRMTIQMAYCDADVPWQVATYVDDDTNLATSFSSAAERPKSTWQAVFVGDGATLPKMYQRYNTKETFGLLGEGNPDLKGNATADPQE